MRVIDPYIAEEQSTDDYAPNDLMQNNVNSLISTACDFESTFDTEAVNNFVVEESPNVHNIEDPPVSVFTEGRLQYTKTKIKNNNNNSLRV